MRIIGGNNRGRHIIAPNDLPARPTTDFAKVALFNILDNHYYFEDVEVLDLFAGTGNIAYEFASRGCIKVSCVDVHRKCTDFIRKTSESLNFEKFTIFQIEALKFIKTSTRKWDIIFADPPYDYEKTEEIPGIIFDRELLKSGGILIVEHDVKHHFEGYPNFSEHRSYGNVHFSFFKNIQNQGNNILLIKS